MVVGPDAEAWYREDVTAEDVESEPDQHVELTGPNLSDGIGRESVHEALGDRPDGDPFDSLQQLRAVHEFERDRTVVHAASPAARRDPRECLP